MNFKRITLLCSAFAALASHTYPAQAQLPADFPHLVVSNYNPGAVSPGCVFLAVGSDLRPSVGTYLVIVTNDGSIVWHQKLDVPAIHDFKVAPNGRLLFAPFIQPRNWAGGGDATHQVRDAGYSLLETISGGNGYVADSHDFKLLPNGNVLQLGYYFNEVNMSPIVPGGHPAALLSGSIVQELDAQRNVIFQWRSWDHFGFQTNVSSTNALISAFNLNTVFKDADGHLVIGSPDWIKKINRQTGAVLWHLGGPQNQFTFAGGGSADDFAGNNLNRLPNGNVLVYANGGPGLVNASSKVHEYQLDELNKVATRLWTYASSPPIQAGHGGSAQRLSNGNTFIGWGEASGAAPACTEITSAGQKVFEIYFTNLLVKSYRAFRFNWPPTDKLQQTRHELSSGNTYAFSIPAVTVDVISIGGGYNELTVVREPYAPANPVFPSTAPQLLPLRVNLLESSIPSCEATLSFDAVSFGFTQPTNLTVYYRSQAGQGIFLAQPTAYNPLSQQLQTTLTMSSSGGDLGEFVFGYPELPDLPLAPLLAEVESYRGVQTHDVVAPKVAATGSVQAVHQQLPILLSWSPRGLARWYALQIATNANFTGLVLDLPFTPAAFYVWSNAAPSTTYHYRVQTWNDGGEGNWSAGSFQTVAPVAVGITTDPAGLSLSIDGTNYTTPINFQWLPGSAHTLTALSPQTAPDGHSRKVFSSWSNGGSQAHLITVPASATNYTALFSTQYLLETSVVPIGAGTISNHPAGPWYDPGQSVSLTARTNAGYRINFWQGVDSASSNTAQLTMNSYRAVQAHFMPSTFPFVVISNYGGVAPEHMIGNIGGRNAEGTRTTYVILDSTGTNALFSSTNNVLSRFVTPQGFDAVGTGGNYQIKDESITVVDSLTTRGYTLDAHDIKILPNGHALLFAGETRTFDMSQMVAGGRTAASVLGNVIQELDGDKRVVFEWHTFDHIAITNSFADLTQASFDYAHINAMTIDPTDNHLLASLRTTSEIVKINRTTGQVMWRLGGKMNQFTFIGEHPENAPYYTVGQHDVHRLANGNLLYFDNGNISGGGLTPSDRTYSRMVEYALDETNMTATLVWEYRHTPDIAANCTGSLKRMPNGNTFIDWGCAVASSGFIVTEVSPAAQVVFEMKHRQTGGISSVLLGGGLTKQFWNSADLVRSASYAGVQAGQTYNSPAAGVSVSISNLTGSAENGLVIRRHLDAVRFPKFSGKAPQVTMEHVVLTGSNIATLQAGLSLNLPDTSYVFDTPKIHNPAQVVVYHRPTQGQGQFSPLPTTFDAGTQKLRVTITQLGEFVFGYPDVPETPYVPAIASPADGSEVNQAAPVNMSWIPQGLIASSELQVATDAAFANLVLNTNNLGSNNFALQNPLPNTDYFWRVRVVNQGGTSAWASASFKTVPPLLQITFPAGGEAWRRFQVVTIRWNDNLPENVALDIFKGGVSNRTIAASIASSGSFVWTVGQFQAFPSGSDYTIRIRSTTNPSLFDFSEPFSMVEIPVINVGSVTRLANGQIQFKASTPGAPQMTVLASTNLTNWEVLGSVPVSNNEAVFTDTTATNHNYRMYRVRVP